ncbi:MAG: hypothetical protein H7230_00630 [Candidatus Parcubacteria bacterium]|nr:hypothetical protein [Candidatus Paceibacterota bacterium]
MDILTSLYPSFYKQWDKETRYLKTKLDEGDKVFTDKLNTVMSSVLRIVPPPTKNTKLLKKIYNFSKYKEDHSVEFLRAKLSKKAKNTTLKFLGFLALREKLDFLEKLAPHHLRLALSPKPLNLGFLPIDKNNFILPYHGVTLLDGLYFRVKYLTDIKYRGGTLYAYKLASDSHILFYSSEEIN